jgi:beta-lactam-binding protein with PASTA domain
LLGIAILALVAFLVFRFVTTGVSTNPGAGTQVTVPDFTGMLYSAAVPIAKQDGLVLVRDQFDSTTGRPTDTILGQDVAPGTIVAKDTSIRLRLATPPVTVAVPYLLNLSEADAVRQIAQAGLQVGTRTETADPIVPAGSVVHQDPGPGANVGKGTTVNYVVSTGPPPTPSPSPSPSASASPSPEPSSSPTAVLTPPPTAPPTPSASPGPRNVGDYTCLTFAAATTAIDGDGFTIGTIAGPATGKIVGQAPPPGANRPFGSSVDLTFEDPPTTITCP